MSTKLRVTEEMKITIIENPKTNDFVEPIALLNKVFSEFPKHNSYNSEIAYEKIKDSKHPAIFEIRDQKTLVAFAIGYERYKDYYHIWELGVDHQYRNNGLASGLYEKIEDFAKTKEFKGVSLNTFNRFKDNIRLIVKRGYEIYDLEKTGKFAGDPKLNFKLHF